jgi:hypothetical protein
MADKKISALTAASTPLGGTEVFPIVQSSTTVKATIANVQAAPVSAGTANGVQYLNASKVPTTGAVFTFDGYTPIVNFASNQIGYKAIGNASSTNPDAGANRGGVVQLQNNDTTDGNGNAVEFYNSNSLTSSYINGINVSHSGRTGAIVFGVANGGAPSEKWRINATGNLVVSTSGNGIDFSATPGTGTSELLADYEEGTWTPVISDGTNNATMGVSNAGKYTKVGNMVTITAYVQLSSKGSISGALRMTGLPFAAGAIYSGAGVGFAGGLSVTAGVSISMYTVASTTYVLLQKFSATTGSTDLLASDMTNSGQFIFSMSYFV